MDSTQSLPRGVAHFLYRLTAAGFECLDNFNVPVWSVCRCQNLRQVAAATPGNMLPAVQRTEE